MPNTAEPPLARGSVHIAVAGRRPGAPQAHEQPAADDDAVAQRRLREAGWALAGQTAPWLSAAGAMLVAIGLLGTPALWWSLSWAGVCTGLGAAWLFSRPSPARPLMPRRLARSQRLFALLGAALLLVLGLVVWLPLAAGPATEGLLLRGAALSLLACVAAVAFAWLGAVLPLALLLPLWPLLVRPISTSQAAIALMGLACAVVLAGLLRQHLRRQVRQQLDHERRIAQAEAACQAAQRADADKTRFVTAASHDLRQPVHALGLFAATLDKRLRGTRDEPLARNVLRSIEGLDRSLNAIMEISRLDAGTVEPKFQHFPLRDVFRRLHMQFAGQAELADLSLRFSPGGKWVTSDPQLLERILGNLIQNAMKYTVRGGIVVVARTTTTHFHVEVWDTGVGIAAAELPRIFDEYYQISGHKSLTLQGLGMGLAIVRRLVRLLGHQLTVASRPGRGTMFRVSIEQGGAADVQDLTAPADTQPMPAGRARTVLIVEDDEPIRLGLTLLLEESGYIALPACGLDEARQILRVLELPPDLLLTDLHLGSGPGGLSVIGEVRRECAYDIPAILITGDTAFDDLDALGKGAHPVLFKPVDPRQLMRCIRELVA